MSKETLTKQTSDERQKGKQQAKQAQTALPYPTNALQRLTDAAAPRPADILALQQTVGNQAVQRTLAESGQHERETNDGKTDLGVVQRQEEGDGSNIAALSERVTIVEAVNQAIIEWTGLKGPIISATKEKVDKVGNYIKESVIPWETKAANKINSIDTRVANLENSSE